MLMLYALVSDGGHLALEAKCWQFEACGKVKAKLEKVVIAFH